METVSVWIVSGFMLFILCMGCAVVFHTFFQRMDRLAHVLSEEEREERRLACLFREGQYASVSADELFLEAREVGTTAVFDPEGGWRIPD